ncbi:MAG: glycosyltransferase family 9 protein [Phycisphaerales bacterium]|nr:MAG: glycosyltransferase family 9 protein [Phycisphaerales bacterium]
MKRIHYPEDPDPRSIMVVLPTWVGDFVMATPTLRAIRDRFANAHITFLVEPNLRDLARGGDWMNECFEWPAKDRRSPLHKEYRDLAWDLRRRRFDWAVLLPNSMRSALIARLAGAGRRIGYDRDGRGLLLTDRLPLRNRRGENASSDRQPGPSAPRPGEPSQVRPRDRVPVPPGRFVPMPLVEYYADLAEAIGCDRPGDRLELFTTPDCDDSVQERLASPGIADRRPLVVISPGARYGAAKCWFPDRFAEVADRLIETEDATVIVTCGPGEEPIARQIGSAMRHKGSIFDSPPLTLGQLKSLVCRCDLLICNDAGPRHFAKAFNVPVVTVFGPTHPEWTATSYEAERIVRIDVDCGPCQQRVCPPGHLKCMYGVTVDMVFEASKDLLKRSWCQSSRRYPV